MTLLTTAAAVMHACFFPLTRETCSDACELWNAVHFHNVSCTMDSAVAPKYSGATTMCAHLWSWCVCVHVCVCVECVCVCVTVCVYVYVCVCV